MTVEYLIWGLFLFGGLLMPCVAGADVQRIGPLKPVPSIPLSETWHQFQILVWPYQTQVIRDFPLYKSLGFTGFQIDRGAGQTEKVEFSKQHQFPYYVGHVADKGFLYLTGEDRQRVSDQSGPTVRPHSLADPETLSRMKEHIAKNISATRKGRVLAYALDDEISLGSMTSPCDVDVHPESLAWFREWLEAEYGSIERLNRQWETSYERFSDVPAVGFKTIRKDAQSPPIADWNLSPWLDFRQFMDYQMAAVVAELVRYANSIDPVRPAGFVGGQAPAPWGGYDYARLSRSVQWIEAYDIYVTNEILRSFLNGSKRPRMMTFFSTSNPKLDAWFLWYYLLHGCHGVIAWPEGWFHTADGSIAPHILENRETFKDVSGEISRFILDSETRFSPDPIGIYYSQPSIGAAWAMDAIVHGRTWPRRKSSIDNENQSAGILRTVWCKTLEDLGYQYDFISYLDVRENSPDLIDRFRVIVLPRAICLSDTEADALRRFVRDGGTLIADALCGLLDGRGKGRAGGGALDSLFGVDRDESAGYLNGKGLTEVDGEKYQRPFLSRFTYTDGAFRHKGLVVFERGTRAGGDATGISVSPDKNGTRMTRISKRTGKGRAIYLNLSPMAYWSPSRRFSEYGAAWREIVGSLLEEAGLRPRLRVFEGDNPANMIEVVHWTSGSDRIVGLIKNPTFKKSLKNLGDNGRIQGITGEAVSITLAFPETARLINLRTGKSLGTGRRFTDDFRPWEANLYKVIDP